MIRTDKGTLLALTGGVRLVQRVQRPKVHERRDRGTKYWFFRYRADELLPDGSVKTKRKFHTIGPSRGGPRADKAAGGGGTRPGAGRTEQRAKRPPRRQS